MSPQQVAFAALKRFVEVEVAEEADCSSSLQVAPEKANEGQGHGLVAKSSPLTNALIRLLRATCAGSGGGGADGGGTVLFAQARLLAVCALRVQVGEKRESDAGDAADEYAGFDE